MKYAVSVLLAAVSAGLLTHAWAGNTGKISGRVTDVKTNEPLIGVNVLLTGTRQGAATDPQGDFFIANVLAGTYTVKASQVGYKDVLITDVIVHTDATTELKISMEQTVLEVGQEVVVTAQRPVVEKDNTATRVYLEATDITSRPAVSVLEVASTLPSINVDNGVMSVRGGLLNEVSFLVDGARARNPLNQEAFTNVNLSAIQEMEIITGSYNAEYGEARSGVFNVITKEGGERYSFYADVRYTPPGVKHWGPSLYDPNTPLYWENTHARHLQWWIDHPDQWVDPNGTYGNSPRSIWTPEQAYQNYIETHRPLTNYDRIPGYQTELSLGGPFPYLPGASFFVSGKYSVQPPLIGNAPVTLGRYFDGSAKVSYQIDPATKLLFSWFMGNSRDSWGFGDVPDTYWANAYGIQSRYAYYDIVGFPSSETDGETIKLTRIPDNSTMYEVKLSRVLAKRSKDVIPGDPYGWDELSGTFDNLRAVEPIYNSADSIISYKNAPGGYSNAIGYHTLGYYNRYHDRNTDWSLSGFYQNQLNKYWQLKAGAEFTYYNLNHYNASKPANVDSNVYNPYQGALYAQNKLEFSGFIMNFGLRFDIYNPNDYTYDSLFTPLEGTKTKTKPFTQISPRLGISHPIDENTVLHFSYGHFFERGSFGDYGEGQNEGDALSSLTTMVIQNSTPLIPWVLGNRALKPEHTIAYEIGIERNFFDQVLLTVTGYYKDIRNTIRTMTITSPYGVYFTEGNGDYADVRGLEVSIRKQASKFSWGSLWGYASFTTQIGIYGSSGSPSSISQTRILYPSSGDYIQHSPQRVKAGFYYETPSETGFLAGVFDRLSLTMDYQLVLPNPDDLSNILTYNGVVFHAPAYQNLNAKIRKDFALFDGRFRFGVYAEIRNVTNFKALNLSLFQSASSQEILKMINSGFSYTPSYDVNGTPYLDLAKYTNIPRSVIFGLNLEL